MKQMGADGADSSSWT